VPTTFYTGKPEREWPVSKSFANFQDSREGLLGLLAEY